MQSSCWNFGKEAHRRTVECYKLFRWLDLHAVMKREGADGAYPVGWIVSEGSRVKAGQLLGLVGTSGRSSEPHLHFQITDGSPLASNGLPYLLTYFAASTRVRSTAAFDRAILDGQPIETEPIPGPGTHSVEMPLDLWIVDFPR